MKKALSHLKSAPSNLSNYKISQKKQKFLNLGLKVPYFGLFRQEFEKTIVTVEISTLEFVSIKKFGKGPKLPHSGTFGLEFEKAIVISEMSTLEFLKDESLTHKVNFGIGSDFSKGLRSPFSEGPGPGSGPHYKVCHCTLLPIIFFHPCLNFYPL